MGTGISEGVNQGKAQKIWMVTDKVDIVEDQMMSGKIGSGVEIQINAVADKESYHKAGDEAGVHGFGTGHVSSFKNQSDVGKDNIAKLELDAVDMVKNLKASH